MSFKIIYGGDHRGIPLKKVLILHAKITKQSFQDIGINTNSLLDYIDVSKRMAEEMFFQPNVMGVSVCRRGYAFAAALNRFPHVRAFNCYSIEDAVYVREKLNANVLCLGNDTISPELACEIVETFLSTPFTEGKHLHCVEKLSKLGQESVFKPIIKVRAIIVQKGKILLCEEEDQENSEEVKYTLPSIESLPMKSLTKTLSRLFSLELQNMVETAQFVGVFEHCNHYKGQFFHEINQIFYLELPSKYFDIFSEPYFSLKTSWFDFKELETLGFNSLRLKQFIKNIIQKEFPLKVIFNDFETKI